MRPQHARGPPGGAALHRTAIFYNVKIDLCTYVLGVCVYIPYEIDYMVFMTINIANKYDILLTYLFMTCIFVKLVPNMLNDLIIFVQSVMI